MPWTALCLSDGAVRELCESGASPEQWAALVTRALTRPPTPQCYARDRESARHPPAARQASRCYLWCYLRSEAARSRQRPREAVTRDKSACSLGSARKPASVVGLVITPGGSFKQGVAGSIPARLTCKFPRGRRFRRTGRDRSGPVRTLADRSGSCLLPILPCGPGRPQALGGRSGSWRGSVRDLERDDDRGR